MKVSKLIQYKKIPYFKLIPVILISLAFYKLLDNFGNVAFYLKKSLYLLGYFVWGFAIAYLLNPLMVYLEKKTHMKRSFSILLVYSIFIGMIVLVITLITPRVIRNMVELVNNMPGFIESSEGWVNDFLINNDTISKYGIQSYLEQNVTYILQNASIYFDIAIRMLVTNLINISSMFLKLLSGIVISLYLLKDKESFIRNIKRLLYALFSENRAANIISFGNKVNIIFKQFVIGKLIDSIIIGFLCFLILWLFHIPNSSTISIIIGITNMIPYFGNIIGMIPACIITLFYSPMKALEVAAIILFLQQLDAWFIGPKILGNKIGLNPLWVIAGIALGSGFFGIMGMFIGVPAIAIIKAALEDFTERKLKAKQIRNI